MESSTIEINKLRLRAFHGVMPQERSVGNIFEISLSLGYPIEKAAREDSLAGTLNYAEVIEIVKAEMAIPSDLIEHVAWRIRESIRRHFPAVTGGSVRVAKLLPPVSGVQLESVAVTIHW